MWTAHTCIGATERFEVCEGLAAVFFFASDVRVARGAACGAVEEWGPAKGPGDQVRARRPPRRVMYQRALVHHKPHRYITGRAATTAVQLVVVNEKAPSPSQHTPPRFSSPLGPQDAQGAHARAVHVSRSSSAIEREGESSDDARAACRVFVHRRRSGDTAVPPPFRRRFWGEAHLASTYPLRIPPPMHEHFLAPASAGAAAAAAPPARPTVFVSFRNDTTDSDASASATSSKVAPGETRAPLVRAAR